MKFFLAPVSLVNFLQQRVLLPGAQLITLLVVLISTANAQQLEINPRSSMVLNGSVSLVVNNAAFNNKGNFVAGTGNSTVAFSGHNDTLVSYVAGSNTTTFNNLTVSKTAHGLALKAAVVVKNVLEVNDGNLYTDSNLTLRSDAALTARVAPVPATSLIIGKTNVERYIPARRSWRLMTAPVTNSNTILNSWQNKGVYALGLGLLVTGPNPTGAAGNGLDYSAQNTVSIKGWNYNTQAFSNVLNTKVPVSAGNSGSGDNTAYFVFVRGDRDPSNTNVSYNNITTVNSIGNLQTGNQTFPAASAKDKYTLIGNPYASPVDFNNVSRTNLIKRMYVWDPSLNLVGGYVMLDDLNDDGIFVKSVPGSSQTKDIQSSQAFFVQTGNNGVASITFKESDKSGYASTAMFRPANPATNNVNGNGSIATSLFLLEANGKNILADGAIAEFDNNYAAAIDLDDAIKFTNTNENISIVRNNTTLAAERRPSLTENDTVFFRLTTTTRRSYELVFEAIGLDQPGLMGFLEDSYLGTSKVIDLSGTTRVNFDITVAPASAAVNRFRLVFKYSITVLPVTISSLKAYQQNNHIEVAWKVENEINMVKYEIEKSTDGVEFSYATTKNVTGSNNSTNAYSWLDIHTKTGNNFYRIKSYDAGGAIKYSAIVKVMIGASNSSFSIYPNPVTDNVINLVINNQPASKYQLTLTNASGQVVLVKSIQTNSNNSTQSLNTGAKLPAGSYQLAIADNNNLVNTQQVIVK